MNSFIQEFFHCYQEIEHYVQNNGDVNQRDKHGNSPLIVCCQVGNKREVKLFLKAGADANASNVRQKASISLFIFR